MEKLVNIKELRNIYKGKKVFLTGHTGFKGSWLLKILHFLDAEVTGYALSPISTPNHYELINGDTLCTSIINDIRDSVSLNKAILDFQPDFIFHLAAQPLVRLSYEIPNQTFMVNAIGCANLLDTLKHMEKKCVVVMITTDKVYFNNETMYYYKETDKLGGYDPYSASKACAELIIDCYRNSFFNINKFNSHKKAIGVARAGNVIGGGDWSSDRLIPDIVKSLKNNKPVEIRNPDSIRPWQHVLDPIMGYLMLGLKLYENPKEFSEAYNFGPECNDRIPVITLVKSALKIWGDGEFYINKQENSLHEAELLQLDSSKAKNVLNWTIKWNAIEALNETISWYKNYYNGVDAKYLTECQIDNFFSHS